MARAIGTPETNFEKFYRTFSKNETEARKNNLTFSEPLMALDLEFSDIVDTARRATSKEALEIQIKRLFAIKKQIQGKFGKQQDRYVRKQYELTLSLLLKEKKLIISDILTKEREKAAKLEKTVNEAADRKDDAARKKIFDRLHRERKNRFRKKKEQERRELIKKQNERLSIEKEEKKSTKKSQQENERLRKQQEKEAQYEKKRQDRFEERKVKDLSVENRAKLLVEAKRQKIEIAIIKSERDTENSIKKSQQKLQIEKQKTRQITFGQALKLKNQRAKNQQQQTALEILKTKEQLRKERQVERQRIRDQEQAIRQAEERKKGGLIRSAGRGTKNIGKRIGSNVLNAIEDELNDPILREAFSVGRDIVGGGVGYLGQKLFGQKQSAIGGSAPLSISSAKPTIGGLLKQKTSGLLGISSNTGGLPNMTGNPANAAIMKELLHQTKLLDKIEKNTGNTASVQTKNYRNTQRGVFGAEENANESGVEKGATKKMSTLGALFGGKKKDEEKGSSIFDGVVDSGKKVGDFLVKGATTAATALGAFVGTKAVGKAILGRVLGAGATAAAGAGAAVGGAGIALPLGLTLGSIFAIDRIKNLYKGGKETSKQYGTSETSAGIADALGGVGLPGNTIGIAKGLDAVGGVFSSIGSIFGLGGSSERENQEQIGRNQEEIRRIKQNIANTDPVQIKAIQDQEQRIRDLEEDNARLINKALKEGWALDPTALSAGIIPGRSRANSGATGTWGDPLRKSSPIPQPELQRRRSKAAQRQMKTSGQKFGQIGSIAAMEESGGAGAGTISSGAGDYGGKSYGTFQLSSNTGTLSDFLKNNPKYGDQFKGLEPGTGAFDSKWKSIAERDPNFGEAQRNYIVQSHVGPQMGKLQGSGIDLSKRGKAVQEALFSTSTQYGPHTSVIENALKGKNVDKMSDSDLISAIQDYKAETVDSYFRSSSSNIRAGVSKRIPREKANLLAMAEQESGAIHMTKSPSDLQGTISQLNEETLKSERNKARKQNVGMTSSTIAPMNNVTNHFSNSMIMPNLRHTENSFIREQEKSWSII